MTDKERAEEVRRLTGWTPPVMYDLATDTWRLATQPDIDRLSAMVALSGQFIARVRTHLATLDNERGELPE